jgi:ribosomal protein L16 Arg81 hydroxylase
LPILWNAARGATPALDRLTHDLAQALGAHVWANVYATGTAGAALDFHFDPHEVLVLQCEGVKEWRVSEVGADRPLDLPAFASAVARELESRRAEARERIEMTFTVEPGDVVYIPRGRFHAARTLTGRSLHVTFGIAPLSGVDFLDVLARAALEDALFRDCLPPRPADPDGRVAVAHLARFRARVLELASSDELIRRLEALIAERIGRSAPPLETDRTTRPREERTDSSMIDKRRTNA